jgi:hypothetical protein
MPHVDEGTLHALLDGELEPAAIAEVRVHFATCPSCAARLDEARQLLAETERLVSALELPGHHAEPRGARDYAADPGAAAADRQPRAAAASVLMPSGPGGPLPPIDPVVLIPENPTPSEVRRSRMRLLAWAAGFLVVVGAGFLGVTSYREAPRSGDGRLEFSPEEFTTAPPRTEREGAARDSAPTLGLQDAVAPATPPPAPAPRPQASAPAAGQPQRAAPPPAQQRNVAPAAPSPATPTSGVPPPRADSARPESDQAASGETKDDARPLAKAADPAPAPPPPPTPESRREAVDRSSAAEATSDLDRRRMREQAAAATAALEERRREAEEERQRRLAAQAESARVTAAAAPPAPRPADDGTGITARIGLDEAARQLGGPLHAIDGMSRRTVGLVSGTTVDGADPDRPVVRAVYVDRSGTMLFLDQQLARGGAGPSTPQTGRGGRQVWVKDGVLLVLHGGGLDADSLRSLARRVR